MSVGPGGEVITQREHREVILLLDHPELSSTRSLFGPGERGPDPHVHREHTDSFYVLEGELTFALGPDGESVRAGAGTLVSIPPNLIHSFWNAGALDARFLNFHTPDGGFAAFMRSMRDTGAGTFDSFDPPADGGLPAAAAIVISEPGRS